MVEGAGWRGPGEPLALLLALALALRCPSRRGNGGMVALQMLADITLMR